MHKVMPVLIAIIIMVLSPALLYAEPIVMAQAAGEPPSALAEGAAAEETSPDSVPVRVTVEPALAVLDVGGNERRFRQYVTPAEGIYLRLLNLQSYSTQALLDLTGSNVGESSAQGSAWMSLLGGAAVVDGQSRTSRFYRDFTVSGTPYQRNDGSYEVKVPAGAGELRLFYDSVSLADQGASPLEDWSRSVPGASFVTRFNNGMLAGVGYDEESFAFHQGAQFSGQAETLRFSFSPRRTERTSIQADAALLQTFFDDRGGKHAGNQFSLRAVHLLTPDLVLTGELSQDEITDTIIRNAYGRRDRGGELALEYSGLPRTTLEVGGRRNHIDYVNGNQTLLIPVDEDSLFARATARLTPQLRLRVIGSNTRTHNEPAAIDSFGVPYGSLVWSQRNDLRTELSFAPTWRTGLTGRLRRTGWTNDSFNTENSLQEGSLYGWWMPRDNVTLYATYLRQNFDLNDVGSNPQQYVSDNETFVYGGSYQASPKMLVDLALTDTNSRGATGTDEWNLWLGFRYALNSSARLALRASLGDFETSDSAPLLNNDHRWVELSLSNLHF